jgi:alanine-synthesizing transaminase
MIPIKPASRVDGVKYAIRDVVLWVAEAKKKGKNILSLNIGDPSPYDFIVPQQMKDAVTKAMADGNNGYSPSEGTAEAVQAIRDEATNYYGIKNIQNIFISNGGSEAIEIALTALLEDGDNVLVPAPGYPLYTAVIGKLRCEENFYYLDENDNWEPDIDDIVSKVNDRTRAIVIINPNNPTGSVYSKAKLLALVEVAKAHNLPIFADEIYSKLLIDDGLEHHSLASLAPDHPVVTFNGLSKNYMAPGWRIGWAVYSGPEELMRDYVEASNKLIRARLCANHPEQYAIKPALEGPQDHIDDAIIKLRKRRDITHERMNNIPNLSCVKPQGAFYAFPKINLDIKDADFVRGLLMETGVLTVHGAGFGQLPGTSHFRVVFLPDMDTLMKSYDLIEKFMRKNY